MAKVQVQKISRELMVMNRDALAALVALATDEAPLAHITNETDRFIVSKLMTQVR